MYLLTRYSFFIVAMILCVAAEAQDATADTPAEPAQLTEQEVEELQQDIIDYLEEISGITSNIATCNGAQLKQLRRELQSVDARWQVFNAMEQADIASTPALMELLAQYKQVYLAAEDSIAAVQTKCNAKATFNCAAAFIRKCIPTYENYLDQAKEYSLVPQTAAQLANLKAQEQLLMQQVSAKYTQAVTAAGIVPGLAGQQSNLEQQYIRILEMSQTIQAAEYKPFIQRIKDYLLSFAAVAIIIMFFSMVVSRISGIKKAREMAKKYGNMMNGQQDDIPTI